MRPEAYAHGQDGEWHVLVGLTDGIDRDVPALCGSTGPWSGVTTLPPAAGDLVHACPDCVRLCAEAGVRVDKWSSASRQHYVDTGRYLTTAETAEAAR